MASQSTGYVTAAYMRIASLAIALYDYLETQPTSWRFYREHWRSRHFSISVVLFVLIRFVSITTLVISNVGFFYDDFTIEACSKFHLLPPIFKVLQAMVSQAILGVRTFNLSRRSKRVGTFILTIYFAATILQWVTTLYHRIPQINQHPRGNCRAFNRATHLGAWIFYAISMIYDVGITAMSIYYLLKYKLFKKNTFMSKVTRMMMYDGLGYLFVLTGVNVLNLILYKTTAEIQTAAASLGYCVSWIMSQRLLIHLYDASRQREGEGSYDQQVTISQNLGTARDVSRAIRAQFGTKNGTSAPFDYSQPVMGIDNNPNRVASPEDLGVQVRVERTVRKDRYGHDRYELEDYSRRSRVQITSRVSVGQ